MFGEPVTRRRSQQVGTDRYNDPIYEDVDVVLEERAAFDPGGSVESLEVGASPVVTTPKLYFREQRPDLTRTDRVVMRDREYQVSSDPADWRSPYGTSLGGLVVELEIGEGS